MTVSTVPVTVACPDWCIVSAADHVEMLWDTEGHLVHYGADIKVPDPTGWVESCFDAPRFHAPFDVSVSSLTRPDGLPTATPTIYVNGHESTPAQARALADAIVTAVEQLEAAQ